MYLCSMEMHLFKNIELNNMPERMNNPFSYEPHPLCIEACRELQAELSQRNDWREEINRGKMFGVLIVEAGNGKIGYLRAYSGQIGGRSDWEGFVPAVFDYLQPDGYFKKHEAEISELNQQIRQIEANETLKKAKSLIDDLQQKRQEVIANYQTKIKEAKEKRDARRQEALSAGKSLSQKEEEAMIKESQFMKAELKRLKKSINEKTALETEYEVYEKDAITEYEVLERIDDTHLRLALYPKTGRTHQLRVHCAHQEGLNAPIIGDPLYGNETATRLHLHAEEITFEHPMTGKKMTITRKADF